MNTKTRLKNIDKNKVKKLSAMDARRHFGEIINKVYYKKEKYIIERDKKPLAVLMPLEEKELFKKYKGAIPFLKIQFKGGKSLSGEIDKIVYGKSNF